MKVVRRKWKWVTFRFRPSTGRQQGQQTQGFVAGSQGVGGLPGVGVGNGFHGPVGNGFGQVSGFVGPSVVPQVPMMPMSSSDQ